MDSIPAIYENGLLRPLIPLDLPEQSQVTIAGFQSAART
jgi:predicted DNA-binding antitoxin AbrB/MazE fold protein